MTRIAPTAGVLHRATDTPVARQPPHDRLLPRHAQAASRFVQESTGTAPSALDLDDLDEALISSFLDHLEHDRHNSARTRNLRLTAIRSLFKYAALRHPEHAEVIARVLSIPPKRFETRRRLPDRRGMPACSTRPTSAAGKAAATARC